MSDAAAQILANGFVEGMGAQQTHWLTEPKVYYTKHEAFIVFMKTSEVLPDSPLVGINSTNYTRRELWKWILITSIHIDIIGILPRVRIVTLNPRANTLRV